MSLVPFDYTMIPAARDVAEEVGNTPFVPKSFRGQRGAVFAAILTGAEAHVGPMQSIAGFDVIEGGAKMKPELQRALVFAAGHEIWFEEHTAVKVTVCGRRSGSDQVTKVTWSLDDAKRAGLAGKTNWQRYPRQMLVARATGELCALVFGDVTKGFSTGGDEDIADDTPAVGPTATAAVEPVARRRRATPPKALIPAEALPDEIDDAETIDDPTSAEMVSGPQLKAIATICSELGWDGGQRRAFCGQIVGREIGSAKTLTKAEASLVIDALDMELADKPEPVAPDGVDPATGEIDDEQAQFAAEAALADDGGDQ